MIRTFTIGLAVVALVSSTAIAQAPAAQPKYSNVCNPFLKSRFVFLP